MLQALSNKIHGWPAILILGIAVFAMSFFGIEGYFTSRTDTFVAKVGKQEISQQQFQDRLNQLRQQASERMGDQFDGAMFEQPAMKQRVLDAMIDQELLRQANDDLGMRVSDVAVRDTIASIPAFQVNGKFDGTTYRAVLASQNKTPTMFENEVRTSLATQLLPDAIDASTVVTDEEVNHFLDLRLQRRGLRYFVMPRPALTDSKVSDDQLKAYYNAHKSDFMAPEQVAVKYVQVNAADLNVPAPSDEDLRARYAKEKQRFVKPEQRLVSHILIDVPKNATPAQQKAALAKASKIAAEATPQDFAKLATKDSEDLGSRRQGGDLGWLEKGVTNKAFDEALFGMQKGQISKPVLSDEGYHILWLRDVRQGQVKPFDEVRDELAKEAVATERDRTYNDVAGKLADKTYQNPSSLEPAAQDLGLQIHSTPLFSREGGKGIAADPKVVKSAFSDDVLVQGNNSGLIQLGKDSSVVIHVDKHVSSTLRPLGEVTDVIRQRILEERVADAASKQAAKLLQRIRKGETMDAVASSIGAQVQTVQDAVRSQPDVPQPVLKAAFLTPHPAKDKPQFDSVALDNDAYALLAVDKVQGGDLSKISPEQRQMLKQSMTKAYGNVATSEFIDALKARTEIKLAKDRM